MRDHFWPCKKGVSGRQHFYMIQTSVNIMFPMFARQGQKVIRQLSCNRICRRSRILDDLGVGEGGSPKEDCGNLFWLTFPEKVMTI